MKYKCEVCGKETESLTTVSSIFGPMSFGYCDDCLESGKEPYRTMVYCVAQVGQYPKDFNKAYINIIKEQLALHNKSEEEFINDVNVVINQLEEDLGWIS
jgi:ribosome-binding protein aMBF1 (putative translation factor)